MTEENTHPTGEETPEQVRRRRALEEWKRKKEEDKRRAQRRATKPFIVAPHKETAAVAPAAEFVHTHAPQRAASSIAPRPTIPAATKKATTIPKPFAFSKKAPAQVKAAEKEPESKPTVTKKPSGFLPRVATLSTRSDAAVSAVEKPPVKPAAQSRGLSKKASAPSVAATRKLPVKDATTSGKCAPKASVESLTASMSTLSVKKGSTKEKATSKLSTFSKRVPSTSATNSAAAAKTPVRKPAVTSHEIEIQTTPSLMIEYMKGLGYARPDADGWDGGDNVSFDAWTPTPPGCERSLYPQVPTTPARFPKVPNLLQCLTKNNFTAEMLAQEGLFWKEQIQTSLMHFYLTPMVLRVVDIENNKVLHEFDVKTPDVEWWSWYSAFYAFKHVGPSIGRSIYQILAVSSVASLKREKQHQRKQRVTFTSNGKHLFSKRPLCTMSTFWKSWIWFELRQGSVSYALEVLYFACSAFEDDETKESLREFWAECALRSLEQMQGPANTMFEIEDGNAASTNMEHPCATLAATPPRKIRSGDLLSEVIPIEAEEGVVAYPSIESPPPPQIHLVDEEPSPPVPKFRFDGYRDPQQLIAETPSPTRSSFENRPFANTPVFPETPTRSAPPTPGTPASIRGTPSRRLFGGLRVPKQGQGNGTPHPFKKKASFLDPEILGLMQEMTIDDHVKEEEPIEEEKDIKKSEKKQMGKKKVGVRFGPDNGGSSVTLLTPVRAKKKDRQVLGVAEVLTPVRRSRRLFSDDDYVARAEDVEKENSSLPEASFEVDPMKMDVSADIKSLNEDKITQILEGHGFAYVPNKALHVDMKKKKVSRNNVGFH
ncbi:hypothetical protein BC832DRAFT_566681 [Gaertneriomyces semiglobifer]|nr:hypothetical protein BC832DRAFT_566681 [Gaertneriomyces semiglobifer]